MMTSFKCCTEFLYLVCHVNYPSFMNENPRCIAAWYLQFLRMHDSNCVNKSRWPWNIELKSKLHILYGWHCSSSFNKHCTGVLSSRGNSCLKILITSTFRWNFTCVWTCGVLVKLYMFTAAFYDRWSFFRAALPGRLDKKWGWSQQSGLTIELKNLHTICIFFKGTWACFIPWRR